VTNQLLSHPLGWACNKRCFDWTLRRLHIPELEVKSIALPQGRESQERSAIETAGAQLTGQRRVEIGRSRAIGRGAKASPSVARFVLLLLLRPASSGAGFSRQIQLALVAGKSRLAQAGVTALLAEAAAAVQARVGVAQIDFRVADVVFPHTWTDRTTFCKKIKFLSPKWWMTSITK
jgi:hypothetical protein